MRETGLTANADATFERVDRHLSPGAALSAKILGGDAVEIHADGAEVVLSDGRCVVDFGSYGVTLLGHRHPAILAALTDSMGSMPTASRVLANPQTAALAAELVDRCGGTLPRVWLGNNGSDAVEAAMKLARRVTGQMRMLVVEGAFHGKTLGALALTTNPAFRAGLETVLAPVSILPRDDPEAVSKELAIGGAAALVFEPIQGEAGVRPIDPAVLERWVDDARGAGCFVISDEIQVGLGRSGPFSPAIAAGLEPDAVLLGKALGGGLMPLSAVIATNALAAPLIADPTWHTATFGGHPLACAAGSAALKALSAAAPHGEQVGRRLGEGLQDLAEEHAGVVVEVRGRGLIWGLELATAGAAGAALIELAQRGLLVSPCLGANSTIRLLPPMAATFEQVDRALEIVAATLPSLVDYVGSVQL